MFSGHVRHVSFCHLLNGNLFTSQNPIIPPTVSDQIRLWELERSRMKFTEGKVIVS